MSGRAFFRLSAAALMTLTFGALVQSVGAEAQGSAPHLTTLRVGFNPTIGQLPIFVAQAKGFFEKNGLDVKFLPTNNTPSLAPGLDTTYDVVAGTPTEFLAAAAQGIDIVAFSAGSKDDRDHQSVGLVVANDGSVTSVKDLAGKAVASSNLSGPGYMATIFQLKRAGVDPATVKFVQIPFGNMFDQLKAGRVQAALAAQPFLGQMVAAGWKSLGDPFLVQSDETVTLLWKTSSKFAKAHPEVLAAWRKSLTEAIEFIKTKEPEARALLVPNLKVTPELAAKAPLSNPWVALKASDLKPWLDVLEEVGAVKPGQIKDLNALVVP
jgi:NitT/TauT family transport system substrate-binding protein